MTSELVGGMNGFEVVNVLQKMFVEMEADGSDIEICSIYDNPKIDGENVASEISRTFYAEKKLFLRKLVVSAEVQMDRQYGTIDIDMRKLLRGPTCSARIRGLLAGAGIFGTILSPSTSIAQYASMALTGACAASHYVSHKLNSNLKGSDPIVAKFDEMFDDEMRYERQKRNSF